MLLRGKESTEHLLLSCKELRGERKTLEKGIGRISLPVLLHMKISIEKTLGFLKHTGIATRKWIYERIEQDELDETVEKEEAEEEEKEAEEEI